MIVRAGSSRKAERVDHARMIVLRGTTSQSRLARCGIDPLYKQSAPASVPHSMSASFGFAAERFYLSRRLSPKNAISSLLPKPADVRANVPETFPHKSNHQLVALDRMLSCDNILSALPCFFFGM